MSSVGKIEVARFNKALRSLADKCRRDMLVRWPSIQFDGDVWPLTSRYGAKMYDVYFRTVVKSFDGKDPAYVLAFRCLMARRALDGKLKSTRAAIVAWRCLAIGSEPLSSLGLVELDSLEKELMRAATPGSAKAILTSLSLLGSMFEELARLNVVRRLAWSPSSESKSLLASMVAQAKASSRRRIEDLDRRVEALSDATKAMLCKDDRLTAIDRSAIAVANILMCAPSRINEPLCMSVSDRYTIDDYAARGAADDAGAVYRAHQLLLMKGSKGAAWSGKPILNFMLALSNECWETILELGQRSRRVLQHYEEFPQKLYLPPELEHLRGKPVTKTAMWQITQLTARQPRQREAVGVGTGVWSTLAKRRSGAPSSIIFVDNPASHRADGTETRHKKLPALPWEIAEAQLLERVNEGMESMRRVTMHTTYRGRLSEMLVLFDSDRTPYIPRAWSDDAVRQRLKSPPWRLRKNSEASVFKKLGLQMTVEGKLIDCFIEPHDTRRWLTTKALEAGERLSDVLINKWANRVDLRQLPTYDLRTADSKARQVNIAVPQELEAITAGLQALGTVENEYGLTVDIATVHGNSLAVTSVEAVMRATENRPVARSGNQIIILYPNRFGVCLHQHHETPCRSYTGCAEGCNEQLTVKGHIPTNDEWRKQNELNNRSIVNQLQALILARNRGLGDDAATLDMHLLTLLKGMDVHSMAGDLISRFHQIKDLIRDHSFRNELEAAFVARGVVARLDDPAVSAGAMIKYHNPAKHAAPGYELAIEERCGGRQEMERRQGDFHEVHPELGPKQLALRDERHRLAGEGENGDEADDEAL